MAKDKQSNEPIENDIGLPPLTGDTWQQYCQQAGEMAMWGYLDSTLHNISALSKILQTAKSFKELRNELSIFVHDRDNFVTSALMSDQDFHDLEKVGTAQSEKKLATAAKVFSEKKHRL